MKVATFTNTYFPHNNGVASSLYAIHKAERPWEEEIFGPMGLPGTNRVGGLSFPLFPDYKYAFSNGGLRDKLEGFDIFHNHTPYGMFYYGIKYSRKFKRPLVGTFHTDPAAIFGSLLSRESPMGIVAETFLWRYLIRIYNKCDEVVIVSKWIGDELRRRGLKKPMSLIPNGIYTQRFNPDNDTGEFRRAYGIPDRPIVLFVGRLQRKKDPETFIRAAMRSRSDAVFVVAGQGELEYRLKRMSKKDKRIIFTGFLPENLLPQAFAAADICVMPSEMETQGMVLLEAMSSGTPCIATKTGISGEVVAPEYLIDTGDREGLSRRMDGLLDDNTGRKRYARRARRLVEKEYSIEANVKKLGELYSKLCRK